MGPWFMSVLDRAAVTPLELALSIWGLLICYIMIRALFGNGKK